MERRLHDFMLRNEHEYAWIFTYTQIRCASWRLAAWWRIRITTSSLVWSWNQSRERQRTQKRFYGYAQQAISGFREWIWPALTVRPDWITALTFGLPMSCLRVSFSFLLYSSFLVRLFWPLLVRGGNAFVGVRRLAISPWAFYHALPASLYLLSDTYWFGADRDWFVGSFFLFPIGVLWYTTGGHFG